MPAIPPELGKKVVSRETTWDSLVRNAWGSEFHAPDPGIYEFSNGRRWDSTDKGRTGIYGVDAPEMLLLDGTQYPDMRDGIYVNPPNTVNPTIGPLDQLGQYQPPGYYNELAVQDGTPRVPVNTPYPGST